jgi:hypothetical protein
MTILKIKTFLKSLFFHIYAGFPKCSKQEILERFAICSGGCDMYNTKDSTCMVCGCNVNQKKVFLNKLAWADQECPLGKWSKK